MEKEKGSTTAAGDGSRGHGEASPRLDSSGNSVGCQRKMTPEERAAAAKFIRAALEFMKKYNAMTEEEVEEEYRRAGKLHTYDSETEWKKCVARVAVVYPPPKFIVKNIDEFMKILEEDEQDLPIGLAGCTGIF